MKMESDCLLQVENIGKYFQLSKSFAARLLFGPRILKAVDQVSFRLAKGETLGLVGESGCGKSTIARLITRLIEPNFGKILFGGTDILALSQHELRPMRRQIQMIFQDPFTSLNPRKKIESILGRPLEIHHGLRGREKRQKVLELLNKVGMGEDHIDRYPHEFSGGQRQRLALARALALNPDLVICDEPVSALDVSIQAQILNLFRKLQEEMRLTYLFISHDLSVVQHMSNDVAVMYSGKIVEFAPIEEIFRFPLHPYTRALISSRYEDREERMKYALRGEIISPINPPAGCRLRKRCLQAISPCAEKEPELRPAGPRHQVACFRV